jgi:hypothetical protein
MSAFSFNGAGLKKFADELGKLPALVKKAEAQTLSNMAYKFREEAAKAVTDEFTARRPDFILRQMRYQRATPSNLEAIAGSVGVNGSPFTGFIEFLGKQDQRKRVPTLAARGGNKAAILPKANRMLAGADFPNLDEGDDYGLPIAARLAMLYKQGTAKRFIMGGPEFPAGLYEFEKGKQTEKGQPKVRMVQSFRKPKPTRRFDWIAAALSKITEAWVTMTHNKNIEAEFMKTKRTFK